MFYDTHTHTKFSADSQMSIDSAVDAAIKNNLKGIAFTDHFDYNYSCNGINENIEFDFDFNEYFKTVSIWRKKLKGTLDILFAVENRTKHYKALPKYPASTRDFSFVCDEELEVGSIFDAVTMWFTTDRVTK